MHGWMDGWGFGAQLFLGLFLFWTESSDVVPGIFWSLSPKSPDHHWPSLPTSFVALPVALGIFRASHVAEVAATQGLLDPTTLQSFAVTTFTFIFG